MRDARITDVGHREAWLLALACIAALTLSLAFSPAEDVRQAYAADAQESALQAAQITKQPQSSTLSPAAVKEKRLGKKQIALTMAGGDTAHIGTNHAGPKIKWTSSNRKVVKVTSTGKYSAKINALKPGKATITAKRGNQKLTCKVTVTGMLSKRSVTLTPFQTTKIRLQGATARKWKTSNEKIVKVSGGTITPQGNGVATITCIDKKGYKYTCTVTVKCPAITCVMNAAGSHNMDDGAGHLTTYFLKRFALTNASGKSVALNSQFIHYYPYGASAAEYYLSGLASTGYLSERNPLVVANGQGAAFVGVGNDNTPRTSTGMFSIRFSVGATRYRAMFHNAGDMIACWRA